MRALVVAAVAALLAGCQGPRIICRDGPPEGVHEVRFENESDRSRFEFTDPAAFAIEDGSLVMVREAVYEPPYRSPLGIAVLREPRVEDFVMRCRVRQTGREYGHRDLVFVFGYQDAEHYYYAHLASEADDTAHHIMLVEGADRRPVTTWRTGGVEWGGTNEWHDVRLEREGTSVRVSFDGVSVLAANDGTLRKGRVGVGSFDDTGAFDELMIFER